MKGQVPCASVYLNDATYIERRAVMISLLDADFLDSDKGNILLPVGEILLSTAVLNFCAAAVNCLTGLLSP